LDILFDATVFELPFSGIAKSTLYLYNACLELNDALAFTGFIRNQVSYPLPSRYRIEKLKRSLLGRRYTSSSISRIISKNNFKAIHFPWNGHIPKNLLGIKKIMTLHDVLPLEIPLYFQDERQRIKYCSEIQYDLNQADIIFTDSEYSKLKMIENFVLSKEPIVLPFGPTINQLPSSDYTHKECFFIYVGGYDKRKGIKSMLKSFFYLHQARKIDYKLLMIGNYKFIDAETEEIFNQCSSAGIVKQIGYISDTSLAEYYSKAIGLIYLSKYEGFGLPPLEAMSLGCPVITTKYTSLPEVCSDAVLYVEPENVQDVANAISSLASSTELRLRLHAKGKVQASKFTWKKSAEIFLNAIQQK